MTMARSLLTLVPEDVIIPVDRLTFLVPARRFQVEGTLLKNGYVSLATEYAMRLLRDAGELTHGELGAFLGFSDGETRTLVQELMLDGYLDAFDDRIRLAGKGESAFDPVTGELSLLDIETFSERVTLDLVSFAPVDEAGSVRLPWIADLEIPNREKAAAASKEGTQGFRSNFGEWRDRRFKSNGNSPIRLHTISGEAVPLGRSTVPLSVPIMYTPSQGDGIDPDFTFLRERGRRDARRDLIEALNGAVKRMVAPGDHANGASLAASWDGGVLVGPGRSPTVNPLSWLQFAARPEPTPLPVEIAPSVRLGGSVTSPGFLSRLSAFLDGVPGPETEGVPVIWLPATHAAWGLSADLVEVSRTIKESLSPKAGIVLMPRSDDDEKSKRDLQRAYGGGRDGRYAPLFDTCVVVPAHLFPLSLEVIVQPGSWAVVLLHIPSRDGFPIPVGYATRNVEVVGSICLAISGVVVSLRDAAVAWASHHGDAASVLADLEHMLET